MERIFFFVVRGRENVRSVAVVEAIMKSSYRGVRAYVFEPGAEVRLPKRVRAVALFDSENSNCHNHALPSARDVPTWARGAFACVRVGPKCSSTNFVSETIAQMVKDFRRPGDKPWKQKIRREELPCRKPRNKLRMVRERGVVTFSFVPNPL